MIKKILKFMHKVLLFAWVLIMMLFGVSLALDNPMVIKPVIFGLHLPEYGLGLYLCIVLFVGVLLGGVTNYILTQKKLFSKNGEIRKIKKEALALEQAQLRG